MRDIPAELVRPYIQKVLDEEGLSANKLAQRIGVPNTTISRPLSPKYKGNVRPGTVAKIAEATSVPLPPNLAPLVKADRSKDLQLAVKIADRIPIGRKLNQDDRAQLVADIIKLVQDHRPALKR